MTPQDLAAIKARADRATPGPWRHESFLSGTEYVHIRKASSKDGPSIIGGDFSDQDGHVGAHMHLHNVPAFQALADQTEEMLVREKASNAEFIAHSRTDVDALVAEVERCWRALGRI